MSAAPSPRERYREELRATILEAGREAFERGGYEAVSMRMLAERVGCSHANIYLYFKDKDAVFDTLVEESFRQFSEGLNRIVKSGRHADPVAVVRKAAYAYIEFGLRNPGAYEFAFVLRRPGHSKSRKTHASYETLRALVKRCIDAKRFRAVDADVAAQALWAAVHGVTSLFLQRPHFPWADRKAVARRVIDSAIDGLLRRP